MEKIEIYQTLRKRTNHHTYSFKKDYDKKCIGLITTISKHDIRNRKLITFDRGGQIWKKLHEWKKIEGIAVCGKDYALP